MGKPEGPEKTPESAKSSPSSPESSEAAPASETLPDVLQGEEVGKLGEGMSEQEIRGCSSDDDCVVSCARDGTCCLEQCGCSQVYNKTFLAKLEERHERCVMGACPKAKCAQPKFINEGACEQGICVLREIPAP